MIRTELQQQVREIVSKTIDKNIGTIGNNDNLIIKMGLDSMSALEIMAAVEQAFKIRIHEKDLPKIASIESIVDILESKLCSR